MGKIIEFPNQQARLERGFEDILDSIVYPSEELKHCVKKNIIPVFLKYNKLPQHSFSVELPSSISPAEEDQLVITIQEEVKNYALKIQLEMMMEITRLYVALCKCELRNKKI